MTYRPLLLALCLVTCGRARPIEETCARWDECDADAGYGEEGPQPDAGPVDAGSDAADSGPPPCTIETWWTLKPTFAASCAGCHPWAGTYQGVLDHPGARAAISSAGMPPPHGLPEAVRARIENWYSCGAPLD